MHLRRAVITAAGQGRRGHPLQRLVDRHGDERSAVAVIVDEAIAAGADEIAIVVAAGEEAAFLSAIDRRPGRLELITQRSSDGYGAAVLLARSFVDDEPFLHFVGDHLYVSDIERCCALQLVEVARRESCAVSAVQPTRESMLPWFGAVGGRRVPNVDGLYEIDTVLEKPTPTLAEQELLVPGLRAGHYLCFFGMHVLTPTIFDLLDASDDTGPRTMSAALGELARRERYLAHQVRGTRYDIGVPYGMFVAQLALALSGKDRSEVLARIVELLARQPHSP